MGWLLGCFRCAGEPQQIKLKKQSSGGANLLSGRANSAAVAHATSPEDLRRVRRSPSNLAVANSNGYVERGWLESSSSSFSENLGFKPNQANKLNRERSFRERLVQEANAVKQLGDEDFRSCHKVLEPLPDSFKATSIKAENDKSGHAYHSWLVSSVVTSNGLLFEASSRSNSPFSGLHENGSLKSRRIQTSQSIDFYDDLGSSSALKCAELNTCRVESGVSDECINGDGVNLQPTYCRVELKTEAAPSKHRIQSPPWTFSEANLDVANYKSSCIFESSDNLLLEHLDVSSLIEDSALITSWELSSGELHSEKWVLHDRSFHSFQVSCQEESKLPKLSMTKQKHLENGMDGYSSDSDSSCSMVIFEVPSDDGTGLLAQPLVGEDCCSSNGSPVRALLDGASCDKEFIHAASNTDHNAKAQLLQADGCTDFDGSDNESGSQGCFSSQFKLSKRPWSSTRKNPSERDSAMEGLLHDNDNNVDEVLIPQRHSEMQLMQKSKNSEDASKEDERHPLLNASIESSESSNDIRVNYDECSDGHVGDHLQSSTPSFLKGLVREGSVEVFAFEDETVAMSIGDLSVVSSPSEEENGDQRKKLRCGHSSSFERMQDSMSAGEDEQVQCSETAFGDCHDSSSVGARVGISNKLESSASEQLLDESCLEQTPNPSFTSSPSSRVQTPMTSYRSPASLADDRPILGTVAAHWSPIATKKWWDGKGIPNSTNKYKEDQKVNWHAIPFEVRLEQALAKQESVLSK